MLLKEGLCGFHILRPLLPCMFFLDCLWKCWTAELNRWRQDYHEYKKSLYFWYLGKQLKVNSTLRSTVSANSEAEPVCTVITILCSALVMLCSLRYCNLNCSFMQLNPVHTVWVRKTVAFSFFSFVHDLTGKMFYNSITHLVSASEAGEHQLNYSEVNGWQREGMGVDREIGTGTHLGRTNLREWAVLGEGTPSQKQKERLGKDKS